MDIAALSVGMNQTSLQQNTNVQVMKMALDTQKEQGDMVSQLLNTQTQMMEQSIRPHIGGNLDLSV